jgi:hypothetical protein
MSNNTTVLFEDLKQLGANLKSSLKGIPVPPADSPNMDKNFEKMINSMNINIQILKQNKKKLETQAKQGDTNAKNMLKALNNGTINQTLNKILKSKSINPLDSKKLSIELTQMAQTMKGVTGNFDIKIGSLVDNYKTLLSNVNVNAEVQRDFLNDLQTKFSNSGFKSDKLVQDLISINSKELDLQEGNKKNLSDLLDEIKVSIGNEKLNGTLEDLNSNIDLSTFTNEKVLSELRNFEKSSKESNEKLFSGGIFKALSSMIGMPGLSSGISAATAAGSGAASATALALLKKFGPKLLAGSKTVGKAIPGAGLVTTVYDGAQGVGKSNDILGLPETNVPTFSQASEAAAINAITMGGIIADPKKVKQKINKVFDRIVTGKPATVESDYAKREREAGQRINGMMGIPGGIDGGEYQGSNIQPGFKAANLSNVAKNRVVKNKVTNYEPRGVQNVLKGAGDCYATVWQDIQQAGLSGSISPKGGTPNRKGQTQMNAFNFAEWALTPEGQSKLLSVNPKSFNGILPGDIVVYGSGQSRSRGYSGHIEIIGKDSKGGLSAFSDYTDIGASQLKESLSNGKVKSGKVHIFRLKEANKGIPNSANKKKSLPLSGNKGSSSAKSIVKNESNISAGGVSSGGGGEGGSSGNSSNTEIKPPASPPIMSNLILPGIDSSEDQSDKPLTKSESKAMDVYNKIKNTAGAMGLTIPDMEGNMSTVKGMETDTKGLFKSKSIPEGVNRVTGLLSKTGSIFDNLLGGIGGLGVNVDDINPISAIENVIRPFTEMDPSYLLNMSKSSMSENITSIPNIPLIGSDVMQNFVNNLPGPGKENDNSVMPIMPKVPKSENKSISKEMDIQDPWIMAMQIFEF